MSQRTPAKWHPLPAMHHRHGKVVHLGQEFGACGPYAFLVLLSEAAAAIYKPEGTVKMAVDDFRRLAFLPDDVDIRRLLGELEDLGFIRLTKCNAYGFELVLPNWDEWSQLPKDRTAAERQRRHRERQREAKAERDQP
jgi:hypothetical protein